MPLISPDQPQKNSTLKLKVPQSLMEEIKDYCQWVQLNKVNHFFVQAAEIVLKQDSDWKSKQTSKKVS